MTAWTAIKETVQEIVTQSSLVATEMSHDPEVKLIRFKKHLSPNIC